ncbi:tyrosine-type recombinase/integrase [Yersinia rochesterensis]|uniref:tyrosine-type recombinase/integrase n=1 Tax=Yersinia rochesterensis TaxID=1604335 RepID=UPI002E273AEB|nr:tyrosine-type recombinase/integrase [Yersinia rochesterensis]
MRNIRVISQPPKHTTFRGDNLYINFRLPSGKFFRQTLGTDSKKQCSLLMASLAPLIPLVQDGALSTEEFRQHVETVRASQHRGYGSIVRLQQPDSVIAQMGDKIDGSVKEKTGLTLIDAWTNYKKDKGKKWAKSINDANERFMQVMFLVLGEKRLVNSIEKDDIRSVMSVVSNLPIRSRSPYNKMTLKALTKIKNVPECDLVGVEFICKHLKIYRSLFKTYLTEEKDILNKSPTDGIKAPPSSNRYGAYSIAEMKLWVNYAVNLPNGWLKWTLLLFAYTGARRSEIATLKKSQIKFDADANCHYLLISEGGGKTENATRQVPIHQHLIDLGFLDYTSSIEGNLFPDVFTNNNKITKVITSLRSELGIPFLDDYGNRRILHSFRHTLITTASGWVSNVTHLQQVVGHEKTGTGLTQRYLHTFPLNTVAYVIQKLNWLE